MKIPDWKKNRISAFIVVSSILVFGPLFVVPLIVGPLFLWKARLCPIQSPETEAISSLLMVGLSILPTMRIPEWRKRNLFIFTAIVISLSLCRHFYRPDFTWQETIEYSLVLPLCFLLTDWFTDRIAETAAELRQAQAATVQSAKWINVPLVRRADTANSQPVQQRPVPKEDIPLQQTVGSSQSGRV